MIRQPPLDTNVLADFQENCSFLFEEEKVIYADIKNINLDIGNEKYYKVLTVDYFGNVREYFKDIFPKTTAWSRGILKY